MEIDFLLSELGRVCQMRKLKGGEFGKINALLEMRKAGINRPKYFGRGRRSSLLADEEPPNNA